MSNITNNVFILGALTIATMGAAAPLLIAGTAVGAAGGLGGVARNFFVGKIKRTKQSAAELAMNNLMNLGEQYNTAVIELARDYKNMSEEQQNVTDEILDMDENANVRKTVKSVLDHPTFQSFAGANKSNKQKAMELMDEAKAIILPTAKTVAKEVAEEAAEATAKTAGKAAGGLVIGVSALFLIADAKTITETAVKLWKKEPSKAAEMLRELARKLSEGEEDQSHEPDYGERLQGGVKNPKV